MTDPIDDRARRAADSVHAATSSTNVPPIDKVTRRAAGDRILGFAFVVALVTGLIAVAALAGTSGTGDDAAQGVGSTTSTSPPPTSSTPETTSTSVSGELHDVWDGKGTLKVELLEPKSFTLLAAAEWTGSEEAEIHFGSEASEMAIRLRVSGEGEPGSTVLVSGIPVEVGTDSVWSHEIDLTLFQGEGTVLVIEVEGKAYGLKLELDDDGPAEHFTGTTLAPGHDGDDDSTVTTVEHEHDHDDGGLSEEETTTTTIG